MTTHLRLAKHKGLELGELNDLRKLNVVTGPNNSGKTTVLECILKSENVLEGDWLSEERDANELLKFLNKSDISGVTTNGVFSTVHDFLQKVTKLRQAIIIAIGDKGFAYPDDAALLSAALLEAVHKVHSISTQTSSPETFPWDLNSFMGDNTFVRQLKESMTACIAAYFQNRFRGGDLTGTSILVTPKRTIEASASLKDGGRVESNGIGLIQQLFFLKSGLPESSGRKFFENYWNAFKNVSGMKFDIDVASNQELTLHFSPADAETWRTAADSGLGLRELMVILYFALDNRHSLILIEEPENHLHPDLQRRLLRFLKTETVERKQFILTTHSNIMLDTYFVDRIFQVALKDGNTVISDVTSKASALTTLGYSVTDNLVKDLTVFVEGESDKEVLTSLLVEMGVYGNRNIKFWSLQGDAMGYTDLGLFVDTSRALVLLDKDPKSSDARRSFLQQCSAYGIPVTTLQRYSIENYFPVDLYRSAFEEIPVIEQFDNEKPVWQQLGQHVTKKAVKAGARRLATKLAMKDIVGTDLEVFLNKVYEVSTPD